MTYPPVYHVSIKFKGDACSQYFSFAKGENDTQDYFEVALRCYVSRLLMYVWDEQRVVPGTRAVESVAFYRTTPQRFMQLLFRTNYKEV